MNQEQTREAGREANIDRAPGDMSESNEQGLTQVTVMTLINHRETDKPDILAKTCV